MTKTSTSNNSVSSSFYAQQAQHANKVVACALQESGLKFEQADVQRVLRSESALGELLGAKISAAARLNLKVFLDQFRLPGTSPSALDMSKLSAIAI